MEPRIKYFLILNAVILSVIFIYIRFFRKKEPLDNFKENPPEGIPSHINIEYFKQTQGTDKDYKNIPILEQKKKINLGGSQSVNVVFTWNGHDWDAYEVLGLPAGSHIDEVNEAYERALTSVDEKSQEFIKKAYRSICQKVS